MRLLVFSAALLSLLVVLMLIAPTAVLGGSYGLMTISLLGWLLMGAAYVALAGVLVGIARVMADRPTSTLR